MRRRVSLIHWYPTPLPVRSFRSGSCPRDSLVHVLFFFSFYFLGGLPAHPLPDPLFFFFICTVDQFLVNGSKGGQIKEIHAGFERAFCTSRAIVCCLLFSSDIFLVFEMKKKIVEEFLNDYPLHEIRFFFVIYWSCVDLYRMEATITRTGKKQQQHQRY